MRIEITPTDQKVLNYIEMYKSITIKQCNKMFYNKQVYGSDMARKRLNKLVQYNKLKVDRDYMTNRNIYYMDKKLSFHDILVMDYFSELINAGVKMISFCREPHFMDNKIIPDAFCTYSVKRDDGKSELFFNIIEVVRTNKIDLNNYKKLYDSGELQKLCRGVFPRIILIDNVNHGGNLFINDDIRIIQLDFKMNEFCKIFL